jgi:ABC-type amino acid transport substrate-binding protein
MASTAYRRVIISVILLAFAAFMSVYGMYQWYKSRPPTREQAFPGGEMVVGVDASFPPFAVDNGESLYGLDIDLAQALGTEMEIPVRFVNMGYDGLYDAVIDGQVDVVISALLVNPARTQEVRYTRPYFDNGLTLITPKDSPIDKMQHLPGHALALEYGSVAQGEAHFWLRRLEAFAVLPYELPSDALDAVRVGAPTGSASTSRRVARTACSPTRRSRRCGRSWTRWRPPPGPGSRRRSRPPHSG